METSPFCLPSIPPTLSQTAPHLVLWRRFSPLPPTLGGARHSWHFVFRSFLLPTLTVHLAVCPLSLLSRVQWKVLCQAEQKRAAQVAREDGETVHSVCGERRLLHFAQKNPNNWQPMMNSGLVTWLSVLNALCSQDLGSSDLRKDVYIVVHIIRIGMIIAYCRVFALIWQNLSLELIYFALVV